MTKTEINFKITGPSLSNLLRDCECSNSDQVGFLIGDRSSITTQTISDADMEEEKIETTISVNGTFPVGLPNIFCNPVGRINDVTLKDILGVCEKDVVGWYMFRRNCTHRPSLRSSILHRELCRVLRPEQDNYFLFSIITSVANDLGATQSLRVTFFIFHHRRFIPVPVAEVNLGEPEDNSYRSETVVEGSFKHLQQVFRSLGNVTSNGKNVMEALHGEVDKHVGKLQTQVSRLQAEVDAHTAKLQADNLNCTVKEQPLQSPQQECSPSTSSFVRRPISQEY